MFLYVKDGQVALTLKRTDSGCQVFLVTFPVVVGQQVFIHMCAHCRKALGIYENEDISRAKYSHILAPEAFGTTVCAEFA